MIDRLKNWFMWYAIIKKKPKLMGPSICNVEDKTRVRCEGAVPWRLISFTELSAGSLVKVERIAGTSRVKITEVLDEH